ncbi:MAG: site-2 protease family protein [Huintestinicola sp.]|uniref:site-2 protease family protein n=1 Tax=Huintestinicola sp. TaxID=2981661 RepID=UPI003F0CE561
MNETVLDYLIKALVLFTAVPVHECAHAWTAEKMGDDTGRQQGRITLNPFAHLTLWGSLMMILVGFGWGKPVSVDPRNFKNPKKGMVLTSLAGPASNFIMAFLAMIVYKVLGILSIVKDNTTMQMVAMVFLYITLINISLAVFNFLPIPPLDGSKIFNAVLPEKWYFTIMRYENIIFIALIILLYSGLLDAPLSFLQGKVIDIMDFLTRWVDYIMISVAGISV